MPSHQRASPNATNASQDDKSRPVVAPCALPPRCATRAHRRGWFWLPNKAWLGHPVGAMGHRFLVKASHSYWRLLFILHGCISSAKHTEAGWPIRLSSSLGFGPAFAAFAKLGPHKPCAWRVRLSQAIAFSAAPVAPCRLSPVRLRIRASPMNSAFHGFITHHPAWPV